MLSRRERIEGGLVGMLVGDALGVPYEFHAQDEIPPAAEIEFEPPRGFLRAHPGVPSGTWSDDGAHALCLLASLLDRGRLDPEDLGRKLVSWYAQGHCAVDEKVFDIGVQTAVALANLRQGMPAREAGPSGEWDNGNGSLMRVLPLALWHDGPDLDLVADARVQSRVTHGHLRSQACCALYCLWARRVLEGLDAELAWTEAVAGLRTLAAGEAAFLAELNEQVRPDQPPGGRGSGYVVDCLHSARWALQVGQTYEDVVKAAISLGEDTDTTACVAGGIAGLRDGISTIPERWRSGLRGQKWLAPLLRQLLAQQETGSSR